MDINQQIKSALEAIKDKEDCNLTIGDHEHMKTYAYVEAVVPKEYAHILSNAPTWLSHQATEIEKQRRQLEIATKALDEIARSNTGLASKLKGMAMKSISEIQEVSNV